MKRRLALAVCALIATPALAQIDGSGTVTTAGVSQVVFPANANRRYLFCENPIAATEALYMNTPGSAAVAASGSYEIAPGGSVNFSTGFIPFGAISVTAATAGHRFVCKVG